MQNCPKLYQYTSSRSNVHTSKGNKSRPLQHYNQSGLPCCPPCPTRFLGPFHRLSSSQLPVNAVSVEALGGCLECSDWQACGDLRQNFHEYILIIIINPSTVRVIGAPQMISQSLSFVFLCSPLPSRIGRTPGLSIPWCCLSTSSSVCLVFFPLSLCFVKCSFAWPDERDDMSILLQFAHPYSCMLVNHEVPHSRAQKKNTSHGQEMLPQDTAHLI